MRADLAEFRRKWVNRYAWLRKNDLTRFCGTPDEHDPDREVIVTIFYRAGRVLHGLNLLVIDATIALADDECGKSALRGSLGGPGVTSGFFGR